MSGIQQTQLRIAIMLVTMPMPKSMLEMALIKSIFVAGMMSRASVGN
ncbi:hypothetical protein [Bradyrhizobium sp. LHD-71]|nr:hypothetical protein [Bradyrhizobium sp. LHD-71]MDQ8730636.1 hypothetical protein [Bradyrhizobium sp. LHD-71]